MFNSNGKKSFDRCDVKTVEIIGRSGLFKDNRYWTVDTKGAPEGSSHTGYRAKLHCPRIDDDDRLNVSSNKKTYQLQEEAVRSVRSIAAQLICRDCMYADMTPVQVSIARKDFAKAETERVLAYKALEAAREDLDQISPPFLTD